VDGVDAGAAGVVRDGPLHEVVALPRVDHHRVAAAVAGAAAGEDRRRALATADAGN
jgi:hypothetical protein